MKSQDFGPNSEACNKGESTWGLVNLRWLKCWSGTVRSFGYDLVNQIQRFERNNILARWKVPYGINGESHRNGDKCLNGGDTCHHHNRPHKHDLKQCWANKNHFQNFFSLFTQENQRKLCNFRSSFAHDLPEKTVAAGQRRRHHLFLRRTSTPKPKHQTLTLPQICRWLRIRPHIKQNILPSTGSASLPRWRFKSPFDSQHHPRLSTANRLKQQSVTRKVQNPNPNFKIKPSNSVIYRN